jgi:aspartate/methionine/tyrosine aminotransferase
VNPAIENVGGSVIRALHGRRKPSTINLGIGEPTLMPNVEYFERATRWVAEHGCRYSTNIGDPDLREAIAAYYAYPGLEHSDNVCITAGSQEAVYVVLRTLLDPAQDELLVVEPAFPVYAKIADVERIPFRRVTATAATGFAIDVDAILEAVGPRTRMLVLCSPSNPTGRVLSKADARRLADGLLARPGAPVYVLHDEIYREIVYTDDVGELGKVYPYTLAINSLSKSNALTGLRLGWVIAPRDVMPEIVKMHGWVTSCANTFSQRVAHAIFAAGDLTGHRAWYAGQFREALAAARDAGLEALEPEGAFYLCLRVGDPDTLGFANTLLDERDVVVIPGDIFAASLRGWVRTSFVSPVAAIREGYARIAAHARERAGLTPAGSPGA